MREPTPADWVIGTIHDGTDPEAAEGIDAPIPKILNVVGECDVCGDELVEAEVCLCMMREDR